MARMGCLLGILLIGFAVAALFALVVIPVLPFGENNPTLMQIKGALVCEPGQQYIMEGHNFSDNRGSGRRFNVYCVGQDGTKVDIIEKDFLAVCCAVPGRSVPHHRRECGVGAWGYTQCDPGCVGIPDDQRWRHKRQWDANPGCAEWQSVHTPRSECAPFRGESNDPCRKTSAA
jgi:hypothetical protein